MPVYPSHLASVYSQQSQHSYTISITMSIGYRLTCTCTCIYSRVYTYMYVHVYTVSLPSILSLCVKSKYSTVHTYNVCMLGLDSFYNYCVHYSNKVLSDVCMHVYVVHVYIHAYSQCSTKTLTMRTYNTTMCTYNTRVCISNTQPIFVDNNSL